MEVNVKLIESMRKERGYTMDKMAQLLNYKVRGTYSNKVNGYRNFTLKDLFVISMIFDIELTDLITK